MLDQNSKRSMGAEFATHEGQDHPTLKRLSDQIQWFGNASRRAQSRYQFIKTTEMILAAAIPVVALLDADWSKYVSAILGAAIVVFEGVQQVNQYHDNWINYRSTAEALKHEKYLFVASAGHYRNTSSPYADLAEQTEALISQEHAKWTSSRVRSAERSSAESNVNPDTTS